MLDNPPGWRDRKGTVLLRNHEHINQRNTIPRT
jgi:hypothetical protein